MQAIVGNSNTPTDVQVIAHLSKEGGKFHLLVEDTSYDFNSMEEVRKQIQALHNQHNTVVIKNTKGGVRTYVHFDPSGAMHKFNTLSDLRTALHNEHHGSWIEQRGEEKRYFLGGSLVTEQAFMEAQDADPTPRGGMFHKFTLLALLTAKVFALSQLFQMPGAYAACPNPMQSFPASAFNPLSFFPEPIQYIVDLGKDPTAELKQAIYNKNYKIVELLLEHGTDPTEVLGTAIYTKNYKIVELLLEHGADPNQELRFAIYTKNYKIVELLLEHGADPNQNLQSAIYQEKYEMVKLFVEHGADPNQGLQSAIYNKNYKIVELLLEHGADPTEVLGTAIYQEEYEIVKLLVEHGADPYIAVLHSLSLGHLNMVYPLMGEADPIKPLVVLGTVLLIYLIRKHRNPMLLRAAEEGNNRKIKLSKYLGANLQILDLNNYTPFDIAAENAHLSSMKLLADLGSTSFQFLPNTADLLGRIRVMESNNTVTYVFWLLKQVQEELGLSGLVSREIVRLIAQHLDMDFGYNKVKQLLLKGTEH